MHVDACQVAAGTYNTRPLSLCHLLLLLSSQFTFYEVCFRSRNLQTNTPMDPTALILSNIRGVLGCNGVRNFHQFSDLRLETLRKRLSRPEADTLTPRSKASIGVVWLLEKVPKLKTNERSSTVDTWLTLLHGHGCTYDIIMEIWASNIKNRSQLVNETTQFRSKVKEMTAELDKRITKIRSAKKELIVPTTVLQTKKPNKVPAPEVAPGKSTSLLAPGTSSVLNLEWKR